MENTKEIHSFVSSLDKSIENLNVALEPALSGSLKQTIEQCSSPQERIKLYHDQLYAVISILFSYLKVIGVKTEEHPIMKELTRIKHSMKNFKTLDEDQQQGQKALERSADKAASFLQQTLGSVGGHATPESMKSPAISSVNFQGTHTKFEDEGSQSEELPKSEEKQEKENKTVKVPTSGQKDGVKSERKKASKGGQKSTKASSKPGAGSKVTKPGKR